MPNAMQIGARDLAAMTAGQRATYDLIASGPRKGVPDPFLAMLDAPHLAQAIQAVGAAIRFAGALTPPIREIAILATAGAFGSGYEWDYHAPIARDAGVAEDTIVATVTGEAAALDDPTAVAIIALCRDAVLRRTIPQDRLAVLVALVGRAVASEIVAIAGYYQVLALFLSAGDLDHAVR